MDFSEKPILNRISIDPRGLMHLPQGPLIARVPDIERLGLL